MLHRVDRPELLRVGLLDDRVLELVDLVVELLEDGEVAVDELVDNQVGQEGGLILGDVGLGLDPLPELIQLRLLALVDSHQVVVRQVEEVLLELDRLVPREWPGRGP